MASLLQVGVDASEWSGQRGLGRYVRCLTECLAEQPGLAITLLAPEHSGVALPPACELIVDARRLPWYSWRLPRLVRRSSVDVVLFPGNHAWWRGPVPGVLTVHDLACMHFPDLLFGSRLEAWYETVRVRRGVRGAAAVCADSQATAADLVRMLGCPPAKISVVPLGVPAPFRQGSTVSLAHVRQEYGLPDAPYVLYAGGLDFRKNVVPLVAAFGELVRAGFPQHLLLVGEYGARRRYYPDVDRPVSELGLQGRVRRLSGVGDEALRTLYTNADLFVFPSLFEGFGLPPLEAMACGAPVVCSSATSLPEVVGEAAELFDPRSPGGLVEAMKRVLADQVRADELRVLGRHRAAQFTFERTAQSVAAVLRAAAALPG